jgi:hypothetical protein
MYHTFTTKYGGGIYLAYGDTCIYCNKSCANLSFELRKYFKNNPENIPSEEPSFIEHTILYSKIFPCENGLSEEEFLIKRLLE